MNRFWFVNEKEIRNVFGGFVQSHFQCRYIRLIEFLAFQIIHSFSWITQKPTMVPMISIVIDQHDTFMFLDCMNVFSFSFIIDFSRKMSYELVCD